MKKNRLTQKPYLQASLLTVVNLAPGQTWDRPAPPCARGWSKPLGLEPNGYDQLPARQRLVNEIDMVRVEINRGHRHLVIGDLTDPPLRPWESTEPSGFLRRSALDNRPGLDNARLRGSVPGMLVAWWRRPLKPGPHVDPAAAFQIHVAAYGLRLSAGNRDQLHHYSWLGEKAPALPEGLLGPAGLILSSSLGLLRQRLMLHLPWLCWPDDGFRRAALENPLDVVTWHAWLDWLQEEGLGHTSNPPSWRRVVGLPRVGPAPDYPPLFTLERTTRFLQAVAQRGYCVHDLDFFAYAVDVLKEVEAGRPLLLNSAPLKPADPFLG